jgi:hypothetical protein
MKSRLLISGMAWTVALACVVVPLVVRARFEAELRQNRETLHAQAERVKALKSGKAGTPSIPDSVDALSGEELSELLRLRGQIGFLREQTNLMQQLRQENARHKSREEEQTPTPKSESQLAEELSADTVACMATILKELPSACDRFAADHDGKAASNFFDLRDYLTRDGHRLTGVYTFEFVRGDGPKPGDTLILRETSPRQKDGKINVRVYGFADGKAIEMSFADEVLDGRNQIRWEREQLGLPPPVFEESR